MNIKKILQEREETIKELKKHNVKTPCNHLNAVCFNVFPFNLWACCECGNRFKTSQIKKV